VKKTTVKASKKEAIGKVSINRNRVICMYFDTIQNLISIIL